jgi:Pretoxin HINT domain
VKSIGRILEIRIGDELIETTPEHPFFVCEKGWVRAKDIVAGDLLVGHEDSRTVVTSVTLTNREATVYNLRVEGDHTYFVGRESWGFSVWVHNAYAARPAADGTTWEIFDKAGDVVVRSGLPKTEAEALAGVFNDGNFGKYLEK